MCDVIVGSKAELEAWLKQKVRYFSFPLGHPQHMSPAAVRLAKETLSHVFSLTARGEDFQGPQEQPIGFGDYWAPMVVRCRPVTGLLFGGREWNFAA